MTLEIILSFLTLSLLEIVLGIDNLIFISIISNKLPDDQRKKAQFIGLSLSLIIRIALLFTISWIMSLTSDLFHVFDVGISGRDLILLSGGLFLLYKSTSEIHEKTKTNKNTKEEQENKGRLSMRNAIIQIIALDVIFSLDSIITAVGITNHFWVMVAAVITAVIVMLLSVKFISDFIDQYPSIRILALSFLLVIGITLIADGLGVHIPKGYIYFAMAFALFVEFLNIRADKRSAND